MRIAALNNRIKSFAHALPDQRWFRFFVLWLAPWLLLEGSLFAAANKGSNILEIFPGGLVVPSLANAVTALLVAALAYKLKHPQGMGGKLVVVAVLGLLFMDYESRLQAAADFMRIFMPSFLVEDGDLLITSLLFIALIAWIAVWLGRRTERVQKKHESLTSRNIVAGFFIFAAFLAGGNMIRVVTMLPELISQSRTKPEAIAAPKDHKPPIDKPDIYYLVVDRYTNRSVLDSAFEYDNSKFLGFLQERGFEVRNEATANYPFTDMSIASTINADYLSKYTDPYAESKVQSHALYHSLIKESSVIRSLKNAGYLYMHVGSWYNATSKSPMADVRYVKEWELAAFGQRKILTGLEGQQLAKTPYYRFLKSKWFKDIVTLHETTGATFVEEQLKSLQDIAEAPNQGGRFIFAHMLVTHPLYFFNADGSYATSVMPDNAGLPIRTKYTNQVTFTNAQLEQLIATIQKKSDGKAVILLTSDEGPYPTEMNPGSGEIVDMRTWSDDWLRMKYGVLQAVYMPKAEPEDLEHLSNVNLFRIVLNRYLGYDLDYLPQCNIAITKSRDYQFIQADITRRLSGDADPFCDKAAGGR